MMQDIFANLHRMLHRLRNRFLKGLKRFLRACYHMGKPMCIFMGSVSLFILVAIIVIIAVPKPGRRKAEAEKEAEALSMQFAVSATLAPTTTPEPEATPTPTPDPAESWIAKGQEGEDVLKMQTRLMELGYLEIDEPTSYFGKVTQYAVELFQRQHELQQDGIAGEETLQLLFSDEAQDYVMKEGAEGDDIRSFQEQLEELGYLTVHQITGYYGSETAKAVTKFQHRNYLSEDGKAGEKTLEAVNSADARVSYTKEQEVIKAKKAAEKAAKASSSSGRIDKMISIAAKQVGKTYVLGKSGPTQFDCSGLVYYCLRQVGVYTRRLNAAGFSRTSSWTKITSMSALKRGDLIFFKSDDSSRVGHVGIYIGSGTMIDASSANGKVMKRSCTSSWSRRNFVCGRRPIS